VSLHALYNNGSFTLVSKRQNVAVFVAVASVDA